jgi:hypothetical protein
MRIRTKVCLLLTSKPPHTWNNRISSLQVQQGRLALIGYRNLWLK